MAGVSRIVVASADPNPQVNGQGLKELSNAGVAVETGLMAGEAEVLNRGFSCVCAKASLGQGENGDQHGWKDSAGKW